MQNDKHLPASVSRIPDLGPNKLQQALEDYDRMVDELAHTKQQLSENITLSNKLLAENDAIKEQMKVQVTFLTSQIDAVTAHRDRLNVALKGITTRYRIIRDCFAQCEKDALAEGLDLNEATVSKDDGSSEDEHQALEDLALHDPSRRPALPFEANRVRKLPNSFSGY